MTNRQQRGVMTKELQITVEASVDNAHTNNNGGCLFAQRDYKCTTQTPDNRHGNAPDLQVCGSVRMIWWGCGGVRDVRQSCDTPCPCNHAVPRHQLPSLSHLEPPLELCDVARHMCHKYPANTGKLLQCISEWTMMSEVTPRISYKYHTKQDAENNV